MVVGIGVVVKELVVDVVEERVVVFGAVDDELVVGAGVVLLDVVGKAVELDEGADVEVTTFSEVVVSRAVVVGTSEVVVRLVGAGVLLLLLV